MILSGEKKEEYREIKPYWVRRLVGNWHQYRPDSAFYQGEYIMPFGVTHICFKNGYAKDSRQILVQWKGLEVKPPNPKWCPEGTQGLCFALILGDVVEKTNV